MMTRSALLQRAGEWTASFGLPGAWRLADGPPELLECAFGLAHQDVSRAVQFVTSLHQQPGRLTRELRSATHLRWQHCAALEMRPDAVNQIRMTPWACERTDTELIVRSDLAQAEFHSARYAVANVVVTTIDEDKSALLGVQNARSTTIEM